MQGRVSIPENWKISFWKCGWGLWPAGMSKSLGCLFPTPRNPAACETRRVWSQKVKESEHVSLRQRAKVDSKRKLVYVLIKCVH